MACNHSSTILRTDEYGNSIRKRVCLSCDEEWEEEIGTGLNAAPSHYLRRKKVAGIFSKQLPWERQEWGAIRPMNRKAAEKIVDGWNQDAATMGMAVEYKCADVILECAKCKQKTNETYKGDLCYGCHVNEKVMQMPPKKPKPIPLVNMKFVTGDKVVRKEGDIWKLPVVNSPMWTEQWAYQGSAKEPYIVSHRTDGVVNGSVTEQGWACACMNFTRNTPRTECKHILKVMMSEGMSVAKRNSLANVDDAQVKAFKAWQKEQAAAGVAVGAAKEGGLKFFDSTGRKFR